MRRGTVASGLLLCLVLPAHADWSYLGPTAGGEVFVDLASRERQSNLGRVRVMANFEQPRAEPGGAKYHSSSSVQEFDCAGRRLHLLSRQTHDGTFAQGASRATPMPAPDPWKAVPAGTRAEGMLALACANQPLLDAPTRDWPHQPLVAGSQTLRHDPMHTRRDGDLLSLRWLMQAPPADVRPPISHMTRSTEVDTTVSCSRQVALTSTGIGRAAVEGQGAATVIAVVTAESALADTLPPELEALVRGLCAAR